MASRIIDRLQQFLNLVPGQALPQQRALGTLEDDSWNLLDTSTQFDEERKHRYQEYDAMDLNSSEISVALDIYGEEASQVSMEEKRTVWVTSKDENTVIALHDLFDKVGLEDHIYGMYRALAKYGDLFVFPMVQQKEGDQNKTPANDYYGIYKMHFLHPATVRVRTDPSDGTRIGYECDSLAILDVNPTMDSSTPDVEQLPDEIKIRAQEGFSPWDLIHGRIMGRELTSEYGSSMVEGVRRIWQTLAMMETAVALTRLIRGSSRLLYKIDTGSASPDEQKKMVDEFYKAVKKREILNIQDPAGARTRFAGGLTDYLSRYRPFRMLDDIFWPVPKDSTSDVTVLQGSPDITGLEDIEQWKNKLRTGLGIPKAYFDQDISGWSANKALSQQDIRFAKKTERVQKAMVALLEQLCASHLLYRGVEEFSFTVHIEPASALALLQRLEVLQQKTQIATELISSASAFGLDKVLWTKHVLRDVLGMSRSDVDKFMTELPDPNPLSPGYYTDANPVGAQGPPGAAGPGADAMPLGAAGQDDGTESEPTGTKPVSDSFSHTTIAGFKPRSSFRQLINDSVQSNPYRKS